MDIQIEATPNPATLKFCPGQVILSGEPIEASPDADLGGKTLVGRLFAISGVTGVFLGRDFVSVTVCAAERWPELRPRITSEVIAAFRDGRDAAPEGMSHGDAGSSAAALGPDDRESRIMAILRILETHVRPAVAQDGGDIRFAGVDGDVVHLAMRGACDGCPSAAMTLKMGVETLLRRQVDGALSVRPVETQSGSPAGAPGGSDA